jgi:hypothetical protein
MESKYMKDFSIDNGVIISKKGIPQAPRWFADGRLAFSFDERGINWVEYFANKDCGGNNLIFVKGLFDTFRCFLLKGKYQYSPEFLNVEILPYGLTADWEIGGDIFKFRVVALEETIVFMLTAPPEISDNYQFKMHFYQSTQLIPAWIGDYRFAPLGMKRMWKDWSYEEKDRLLIGGFVEEEEDNTDIAWQLHIGIGSNQPYKVNRKQINERIDCISEELRPEETYVFYVAMDSSNELCKEKCQKISDHYNDILGQQYKRYETIRNSIPRLRCKVKELEDFFALAPLYHESLKPKDMEGAVRAQTSRYWIWGWDSMIANTATGYWGDVAQLKAMLTFFEETSDLEKGIAHAYTLSNHPASYMDAATQGLYLCLLQSYYSMTGDHEKVLQHYSFAYEIYQRMLHNWNDMAGIFEGTSLFPDFPKMMKETGKDLSLFNNTVAYSSLRSMQILAELKGDVKTSQEAYDFCIKMENNFDKLLYDNEVGFYVNSADSETLEQRASYNAGGVFWDNEFCEDLVYKTMPECMSFMQNNCVCAAGICAIPVWDDSYDMDANQLHCTWPAVEGYFVNTANRMKQTDLLQFWSERVGYWTRKLLCPEGTSYMIETDAPELDNWNANSGIWQAYSMRNWYQNILHAYLGITCDNGGFTFSPSGTGDYKVESLHYRGGKWTIEGCGSGHYVDYIKIGQYHIRKSWKIPLDLLETAGSTAIQIVTKEKEDDLYLKKCSEASVRSFIADETGLFFKLTGLGECKVYFHSIVKVQVFENDEHISFSYDQNTGNGVISLYLINGNEYSLAIKICN